MGRNSRKRVHSSSNDIDSKASPGPFLIAQYGEANNNNSNVVSKNSLEILSVPITKANYITSPNPSNGDFLRLKTKVELTSEQIKEQFTTSTAPPNIRTRPEVFKDELGVVPQLVAFVQGLNSQ
ncbi:unnamed protein product, partial [Heterobilharzia americana]